MRVIDVQVHAYEHNHPDRPWVDKLHGPDSANMREMTAAMDAVGAELVRRNPDTVIVIDHLGLLQPNAPPPFENPWADLPKLLALAAYPNVRVKISGACTLSRQAFPYDDIWDPVLRIIDAFGIDRCMWGTDWTRTNGMLTYEQGVAPFHNTTRLSDSDKTKLMGGTLEKVYKW